MAEINKNAVKYRQIDQKSALLVIKMTNPKLYSKIMMIREEHSCIMNLPVERLIPVMLAAVEGLIADGLCKRKKF